MPDATPPPSPSDTERKIIAGFWRRFLAALIDGLTLGVPTFLLGFLLFAEFARLGGWGRAVGFFVALLYCGLLNSKVGNGQTIGKRLLKIRVVGLDRTPISISRSLLRFFVLGSPYFLNGAAFPTGIFNSWIGDLVAIVIFGVGGSILYLLVFNRRNRRSLHDLVGRTVVVKADPAGQLPPMAIWAGHYVVVTLLILTFLCGPIFLTRFVQRSPYKGVFAMQSALLAQEEIWYAAVFSGKGVSFGPGGRTVTTTTAATVWTNQPIRDYEKFANRIAGIVFDSYPGALTTDRVVINVTYGYDLGIASGRIGHGFDYSPAEWQQRIRAR